VSRSGWAVAVAGVVLVVLGRVLGLTDLYIFGAVLECLVLACLGWVLVTRPKLSVDRHVRPDRVTVGSNSRVELTITNVGTRRSPVVGIRDPVSGTAGAELLLAPLVPGEEVTSTYHLPTTARGLLQVGPLDVVGADPFGLTRLVRRSAPLVEVTVLPRIDQLDAVIASTGNDPHGGTPRSRRAGRTGDEFHALRPYEVGDDLRRVHWASTARSGELMVRHDETPWQGRTTVLVDLRPTGDLLERVISAAASVLVAAWNRGDLTRLVTSDGSDSGFGTSHAHLDAALEHLALAVTNPSGELGRAAHLLDRGSAGGLIAVLARPTAADLAMATMTQSAFHSATVVVLDADPTSVTGVIGSTGDHGRAVILTVGADQDFSAVWNQAVGRRGTSRMAARVAVSAP